MADCVTAFCCFVAAREASNSQLAYLAAGADESVEWSPLGLDRGAFQRPPAPSHSTSGNELTLTLPRVD